LTDVQCLDWLRLIRSQNVGPRGIMAQTPQAPFVEDNNKKLQAVKCLIVLLKTKADNHSH
jgi:hypothetical protein